MRWKDDHPQAHQRCHLCWNLEPVCACLREVTMRKLTPEAQEMAREWSARQRAARMWREGFNSWLTQYDDNVDWRSSDSTSNQRLDGLAQMIWGPAGKPEPYNPVVEAEKIIYQEGEE